MKATRFAKPLALFLCALLLLCACAQTGDSSSVPEGGAASAEGGGRRTIPYGQMKYERPDTEALKTQITALTQQLVEAEDFAAALALDEEMDDLLEGFSTQYTLAYLHLYQDMTDSFYTEENSFLGQELVDIQNLTNLFNSELVYGAFADDFRAEWGEHVFESVRLSTLFTSEGVAEYQKERNQLSEDYNQMIFSNAVPAPDGTEYTLYDIIAVDSAVLYAQLFQAYMDTYLEDYAALYARMIALDKQTAYELGFADAATMYYLQYNRDYAPADAKTLFAGVKEHLVPVVPSGHYDGGAVSYDRFFSSMGQAMEEFGPEFAEAWAFMLEYDLYDCEPSAQKRQGVAFNTTISGYDAPFIFSNYGGDFYSADTLMHEFGHFYDAYLHYDDVVVSNLDIAETYSQSMELLMQPYYHLFTDEVAQAQKEVLTNLLQSGLVWQSALEDFQLRAYELDTFDGTQLGRLFAEVSEEYGFDTYYSADMYGAVNTWIFYSTLFETPFYTVSYVTSATAALQIWAQSHTDWEGALETYQTLIHADQNLPYTALLAQAGLKAPQDTSVLREIAALYAEEFAHETEEATNPWLPDEDELEQAA